MEHIDPPPSPEEPALIQPPEPIPWKLLPFSLPGNVVITAALVHEANSTLNFPFAEHVSSVAGSWAVCLTGIWGSDRVGRFLEGKGHHKGAERVRRAGTAVGGLGAAAYHLSAESGYVPYLGVADKWDAAAGIIGVIGGIAHGKAYVKEKRERRERKQATS